MIKIHTLGEFDIKKNCESMLTKIGHQSTLILLFKYFLTYEGRRLLPDRIVEDLMEDKDFKEPDNVLRTQISRLRRLFGDDMFYTIDFFNGYYIFKLRDDTTVDYIELEKQIYQGNVIVDIRAEEAVDILREALALYKGIYLPEVEYNEWIDPFRNRLDRIYLKGLANYLKLLKKKGLHYEIIEICERAIHVKPYEEFINKYFMEALMEVGQKRYALSHYEYYTSKLYNDLRIAPSQEIKELYKELQSREDTLKGPIDLAMLDKELVLNKYDNGALICDLHHFKFLYNWEIRNKHRNPREDIFLGIITLDNIGYTTLTADEIKQSMDTLMDIVYRDLRKNDVLSKWNDSQLVVLLYNISEEDLHLINDRLQKDFEKEIENKNITLNIRFKHI